MVEPEALSAYAKKTDLHSHSNKTVLDALSDNNGTLQYNGTDITVAEVFKYLDADTAKLALNAIRIRYNIN